MRIHLSQIKDFAKCPRYYYFRQAAKQRPTGAQQALFEFVLKRCHIQATETGYRTAWRTVVGWVDKEVFRDVDVENDEQYEVAKKNSEHILLALQKWYEGFYMKEHYESYIDIELWQEAGDHVVGGQLPVIQAAEVPIVTIIQEGSTSPIEVYNDLMIRGLTYLAVSTLGCDTIKFRVFGLGPRGGLEVIEQEFTNVVTVRAWRPIQEIAKLIAQRIDYVSRTEQCKSCAFLRRCKL